MSRTHDIKGSTPRNSFCLVPYGDRICPDLPFHRIQSTIRLCPCHAPCDGNSRRGIYSPRSSEQYVDVTSVDETIVVRIHLDHPSNPVSGP